jgi:hypothetical protein
MCFSSIFKFLAICWIVGREQCVKVKEVSDVTENPSVSIFKNNDSSGSRGELISKIDGNVFQTEWRT